MNGLWFIPLLMGSVIQKMEIRRVQATWEIEVQATEPFPFQLFPVHEPYQGLIIDLPGEHIDFRVFRRLPGRDGIRRVSITRFREVTQMLRIFIETTGDFTFSHRQEGDRLIVRLTVAHSPEPLRADRPPRKERKEKAATPRPLSPPTVDLVFSNVSPEMAIQAFSLATGVVLEVVEGALEGKPPVRLDLRGKLLPEALRDLAKALGVRVEEVSPGHYRLRP